MENFNSKYAIINITNGNNAMIQLYNDKKELNYSPLYDEVFENVSFTFNENDVLTINGDVWEFGISFNDCKPESFDYEIHPDYIRSTRVRCKPIVRSGWHRKLKNKHKTLIVNNYIISKDNDTYERKNRHY